MTQPNLKSLADEAEESAERLEQRALDGVDFGIAQLKRLRRRLSRFLRPNGVLVPSRAIAALAAVQTALTTVSPLHLRELAKRIRRHLPPELR